jgi:hypothetical protein
VMPRRISQPIIKPDLQAASAARRPGLSPKHCSVLTYTVLVAAASALQRAGVA